VRSAATGWPPTGGALLDNGSLARLFWGVFDAFDYWLTRERLWAADAGVLPRAGDGG
jgi:hypothetical protein